MESGSSRRTGGGQRWCDGLQDDVEAERRRIRGRRGVGAQGGASSKQMAVRLHELEASSAVVVHITHPLCR